LLAARAPLYARADITVDTSGVAVADVVGQVLNSLKSRAASVASE